MTHLPSLITPWARLWGIPDLPDHVQVSFSARLRRSLGRCRPATGRITLHPGLRDAAPSAPRRPLHFEHRCPVCHSVRLARRPVRH